MRECWANSAGDCSDRLSREHPVSQGIFADEDSISVAGITQIAGGGLKQNLAVRSIVAKVLCIHHNAILGRLDDSAVALQRAVRSARSTPETATVEIDGILLERWCLKALCGVLSAGWSGLGKRVPSPAVVDAVLGRCPIVAPWGFYGLKGISQSALFIDAVNSSMVAAVGDDRDVLGAMFSLSGFPFFCRTNTIDPTAVLNRKGSVGEYELTRAELVYRPREMSLWIGAEDELRLRVFLRWPDR
jgi:hypothetical protein